MDSYLEVNMARDIVCDMPVDEDQARQNGLFSDYNGVTMYFCGADCKQQFDATPDHYMTGKPSGLYAGQRIEQSEPTADHPASTPV
jgi:YHS domain-containing protein